jgi:hypothetical protein
MEKVVVFKQKEGITEVHDAPQGRASIRTAMMHSGCF